MIPAWLPPLAETHVILSLLSAAWVTIDIFALGRRQPMTVMDFVWPLTLLYWGPLGLPFYHAFGRAPGRGGEHHHDDDKPMWQSVFTGSTHCGAGCALGDLIGDWIAFLTAFALFGSALAGKFVLSFALAYLLGIGFQYAAIAPMRDAGTTTVIRAALKIDTLSIVSYEIGMFVVMGLRTWLMPGLEPTDWTYWFMMQVAMLVGFWTTFPVNWWLIARGTKERM
jgi:Domain of unknown function (DUF4396)